jgi:hypothetical protein
MTPVRHRRQISGMALCGAREFDGAKFGRSLNYVNCAECWAKTRAIRVKAAKVRR